MVARCRAIVLAFFSLLAVLWLIGKFLYPMELDGQGKKQDASIISAEPADTLSAVFRSLPAQGVFDSRIELLDDNVAAWAARWRLLADARDTLEISYFILDADIYGISFLGHLLHKAEQGVRVRILLDAIGTALSREIDGNDYLDALAGTRNVTIKMYRPYIFRFRDAFLQLNPVTFLASEHDKILLADGRSAIIGGRNIAREYLADPLDYGRSFRDCDVLLTAGRAGDGLKGIFNKEFESSQAREVTREVIDIKDSAADLLLAYEAMDAWVRGRRMPEQVAAAIRKRGLPWLDDLGKLPRIKGIVNKRSGPALSAEVRVIDSRPRVMRSDDAVTRSLERLVRAARREIFIQTPYLILSRDALSVLEDAAFRGVCITILTNSPVSTDNPLSQAFFLEQWPRLMAKVSTLRLFVAADGHNIHSKLAVIDDQLGIIGTYNLDPMSMGFNGELIAAVWSDTFARQLLDRPRRLIAGGAPTVQEYRIARDERGQPAWDKNGRIVIAYGPEDHSSPDQWKTVQLYRRLIRIVENMPGTSRILWE